MLPNDPRLALSQANATMSERHRQAQQGRLAALARSSALPESQAGWRARSSPFHRIAAALLVGLRHQRAAESAADDAAHAAGS